MKTKKTGRLFFFLYLIVLLRITVFRSDFGTHPLLADGRISLTLFKDYIPLVKGGHWRLFLYLFLGNIIWFVPFGMYLKYIEKPRTGLSLLLCGFLFSFLIESLQYIFGTGYSELDDLILNTLGTGIGAAFVHIVKRIRNRPA